VSFSSSRSVDCVEASSIIFNNNSVKYFHTPRRHGVYPRLVDVRYVFEKVALGQVFVGITPLSPLPITPQILHNVMHFCLSNRDIKYTEL
jgi:hypothetical protein